MSLDDQDLSSLIRRNATRHAAPDTLRAAIRTQIALADAGRTEPTTPPKAPRRAWFTLPWPTASVSFALGLACALFVLPLAQHLDLNGPLDTELVADHVRALQVGPLTEVVSTDRHTVKPWFQGRLDYAPPVFDLAAQGFPLMGGRIEHLRGNAIAALPYARNRHVVDVFVWQAPRCRCRCAASTGASTCCTGPTGRCSTGPWPISSVPRWSVSRNCGGSRLRPSESPLC